VWQLVHDFLGDTFAFDGRLWHTIPLLVARPGVLAAEYVGGRRARYVPPLRVYVFLSALFFGVLTLTDGGPLRFAATTEGEDVSIVSAFGIRIGATGISAAAEGSFAAGVSRAAEEVERLNAVMVATLSYVHFLLLPVLALILQQLWRRRWYVEHLVFGIYFGAFTLLTGSVVIAAYALIGNPHPERAAAKIAILAWDGIVAAMLYRALRDMYGAGRLRTIVRLLVLLFFYFVTASATVIVIAFATIRLLY
jgi:hypothetical protein